jgi:hypothetical protein
MKLLSAFLIVLVSAGWVRAADPEGFALWKGSSVKNSQEDLASKIDDQKFAWDALAPMKTTSSEFPIAKETAALSCTKRKSIS